MRLAIGLGLLTQIQIAAPNLEQPREAGMGRDSINVESMPGSVTLPPELRVRKCKTLYEGYRHIFVYQKVVAKHFEAATSYLAVKTREVEEQLAQA